MSSGNETIVKVKRVHIVGGHAAVDVDALTNAFTSHDLQYFNHHFFTSVMTNLVCPPTSNPVGHTLRSSTIAELSFRNVYPQLNLQLDKKRLRHFEQW